MIEAAVHHVVLEAKVAGVVRLAITTGVVAPIPPSTPSPVPPRLLCRSIVTVVVASVHAATVATRARACCGSTLDEAIMVTAAAHSCGSCAIVAGLVGLAES